MTLARSAERLTVYLCQEDRHAAVPDYVRIVEWARAAGMAGATVLQGVEGFGRPGTLRRRRAVTGSGDLPVVVAVVDSTERIDALLATLPELAPEGVVVRQPVEVLLHRSGDEGGRLS